MRIGFRACRRESRWQAALRFCFVASVWLTILYGGFGVVIHLMRAADIHATWGPFAARVFLAPFMLAGMQLLWWFTVYVPYGTEGRPIMIMMGVFFLVVLLVMRLNASLHGLEPGSMSYLVFWLAAAAHLAYGFFGPE